MHVLLAPDKFKGSLTSQQVCDAMASSISKHHPSWTIEKAPMADGGEGTGSLLTKLSGGKTVSTKARDPLFREIETSYGLSPDGQTAFIEMASASGLQLLEPHERNPMLTSSIGTGDLIAHALKSGVKLIVIGCGGSATNDGGIGMATALGISFFDSNDEKIFPIGANLSKIVAIYFDQALPEIASTTFVILADVTNPLTGPNGAANVFGPQKGASGSDIVLLDKGLHHFSQILNKYFPSGMADFFGAGAAGGFPVSARAFLKADLKSGIEFIMDFSGLEEKIKRADLIITGEGKFDQQSLKGKVVSGVACLCQKHTKKLWVVCGISEVDDETAKGIGIECVLSISSAALNVEESISQAENLLIRTMESAMKYGI